MTVAGSKGSPALVRMRLRMTVEETCALPRICTSSTGRPLYSVALRRDWRMSMAPPAPGAAPGAGAGPGGAARAGADARAATTTPARAAARIVRHARRRKLDRPSDGLNITLDLPCDGPANA